MIEKDMLPSRGYVDIQACYHRLGMGDFEAIEWLSENEPSDLGVFDYRDLLVLATRSHVFPLKTKMGRWQSIVGRWLGYAWDRGENALALSLVHRAMTGVTQKTAMRAWPKVLSKLDVGGQKAIGAYLKQIDAGYWTGSRVTMPQTWRENLQAMITPSAFRWVTPQMIESWSDTDILTAAYATRSGALGGGIMLAWLNDVSVLGERLEKVVVALRAPGITGMERTALVARSSLALMAVDKQTQTTFYAHLEGAETVRALGSITGGKYLSVRVLPVPDQIRCLATIYSRIGVAPWAIILMPETQKRICEDLQEPLIWDAIGPSSRRHLVLLIVASGVASEQERGWCRSKLEEVGLSGGLLDIAQTLGLRSWPEMLAVAQGATEHVDLPLAL